AKIRIIGGPGPFLSDRMVAGGHPPPSYQQSKRLPAAKVRGTHYSRNCQLMAKESAFQALLEDISSAFFATKMS
ncbi:MAG: hypothetical protein IJP81_01830, partial [Bacteroidales bacterium]|nr:hypothetical protein [Bacteroidales bacterium]